MSDQEICQKKVSLASELVNVISSTENKHNLKMYLLQVKNNIIFSNSHKPDIASLRYFLLGNDSGTQVPSILLLCNFSTWLPSLHIHLWQASRRWTTKYVRFSGVRSRSDICGHIPWTRTLVGPSNCKGAWGFSLVVCPGRRDKEEIAGFSHTFSSS